MRVGRFIGTNGAVIAVSVLSLRRGNAVAAVIAVAFVTFPSTGIGSSAGAGIRGVIGSFIRAVFAVAA